MTLTLTPVMDLGDVQPFADWLDAHGMPVRAVLSATPGEKKHLPKEKRLACRRKVVLGTFVSQWVTHHRGACWDALKDTADGKLFQVAVILSNDERAFGKAILKFVRLPRPECGKLKLRDKAAFGDFVITNAAELSQRMLERFDASRPSAANTALNYLATITVSQFLKGLLRSRERFSEGGVLSYLEAQDTKLTERMRLAFKLVYLPLALAKGEVEALAKKHGLPNPGHRPQAVRAVAAALRFGSAANLSRRLYRVRAWGRRWEGRRRPTPTQKLRTKDPRDDV